MIPIVFHNGSKYDYRFIIRELGREFKYYLEWLGENTEKYITFPVTIKKVLDKDKNDDNDSDIDSDKNEKNGKDKKKDKDKKNRIITCRLRFIDSCRFMQDSLLNLVHNSEPDTKNNTKLDTKNNTKEKDTKNNTKPDTKNNTKPDTENDIEWDINDTRASKKKIKYQ